MGEKKGRMDDENKPETGKECVPEKIHPLNRYRGILDTVPDIIMEVDINRVYTWANRAGLDFFGYDVIGNKASHYFEGEQDTCDKFEPLFHSDENIIHREICQRRKDSNKRLLSWCFQLTKDGEGKVNGAISTARDITERSKAEDDLKRSEKEFRDIFNNATDAIYIQDKEGRFLEVNQGAVDMYGYPREFFMGKTPEFLSAPGKNDMNMIIGFVEDAFNGKPRQYDFWGIRKNGEVFPKIVRSQQGFYQGQKVIITYALDITERRKAEEALKINEERHKTFIDSATEGFMFYDKYLILKDINAKALEIFPRGTKRETLIGKSMMEISPDIEKTGRLSIYKEIIRTGEPHDFEDLTLHRRYRQRHVSQKTFKMGEGLGLIFTDITDKLKAEREIEYERNKANSYLDIAGSMIVALDRKGNVTLINRSGAEVLGYRQKDIFGKNWIKEYIPVESRKSVGKTFRDLIAGERIRSRYLENIVVNSKGEKRLIGWYNKVLKDDDGNIVGTLSSGNDITDKRRATTELKKALDREKSLGDIIRYASIALCVADPDGNLIDCNKAFCQLTGYDFDEIIGTAAWNTKITPERWLEIEKDNLKELNNKNRSVIYEKEYVKKNGIIVPVELSAMIQCGPDGNLDHHVYFIRDITHRKEAEKQIKDLARIPHENPSPVLRIDSKFNLTNYNDPASGFMDDMDMKKGKVMSKFWRRNVGKVLRSNNIHIVEKQIDDRIHSISFTPIADRGYVNIYGQDITDRWEAELERERLIGEVEGKNKELEQIIHISSHDLRSPLVNIQGFSHELSNAVDDLRELIESSKDIETLSKNVQSIIDNDIDVSVKYIQSSVNRIDSLLNGLLKISRLGRAAVKIRRLNMNRLMKEVLRSFEFSLMELNAEIIVEDLPPCRGDRQQLMQAFSNLVDNAIKYRHPDRQLRIEIGSKEQDCGIIYTVKDNGKGIKEEHQESIFQIFHRLDPKGVPGEGLGLTIVQRVVERSDGDIWVKSTVDEGSSFHVLLQSP